MSSKNKELWTSGFFEAPAGTFFFRKSAAGKNSGLPYVYYPSIKYMDNDGRRLKKLKDELGGNILNDNRTWVVSGESAVEVAQLMQGLSPMRQHIVDAFIQWGSYDTHTAATEYVMELLALYSKQIELSKRSNVLKSEYYQQVIHHSFLGGIVDARGNFFFLQNEDKFGVKRPALNLHVQNDVLLEAIHDQFGGSKPSVVTGEYGKSFFWAISRWQLYMLMQDLAPHIVARDISDFVEYFSATYTRPETPEEVFQNLSPSELALFEFLLKTSGQPVSADEIFAHVWPDITSEGRSKMSVLSMTLLNLKKKVEPELCEITFEQSVGYTLLVK
jgi:hypothetical protein